MSGSQVLWLDECDADCAPRVGGKALGLGALLRDGRPVPPGFVVTTDAYAEGTDTTGLRAEIAAILKGADGLAAQQEASERIGALFEAADLAGSVVAEVEAAYRRLCGATALDVPVAVRSSATAEDRADASFAGQQETYLWIRGADEVKRHVLRCWASLFTPQAIAYRAHLGVPLEGLAMAVVVQRMVAADAAGVMITLDPVTGDRSQISIESSYGLGLAVVGGEVTPDRFAVDKVTWDIRSRAIGPKAFAYRFDPARGRVVTQDVPPDDQAMPSLSDEEVIRLAQLGREVEKANGGPQDVEWAIGPGPEGPRELFLLQMRPETVWSRKRASPLSDPNEDIMSRMIRAMHTPMRLRGARPGDRDGTPTGDSAR